MTGRAELTRLDHVDRVRDPRFLKAGSGLPRSTRAG
jgi:hypothetical protein